MKKKNNLTWHMLEFFSSDWIGIKQLYCVKFQILVKACWMQIYKWYDMQSIHVIIKYDYAFKCEFIWLPLNYTCPKISPSA